MKPEIMLLRLAAPLHYFKRDEEPFSAEHTEQKEGAEKLFCFEINPREALEFEPDAGSFLGPLVFGAAAGQDNPPADGAAEKIELPKGQYLFAQTRRVLNPREIVEMAIELQQEGLWQRLEPGKRLYLRYLTEDGGAVTQVLRPYVEKPDESCKS